MKRTPCELCGAVATVRCDSDAAFLCTPCDAAVHAANFLVARHVRQPLCSVCRALLHDRAFSGAGSHLHRPICSSCASDPSDSDSSSSASSCISTADKICDFEETPRNVRPVLPSKKRSTASSRRHPKRLAVCSGLPFKRISAVLHRPDGGDSSPSSSSSSS